MTLRRCTAVLVFLCVLSPAASVTAEALQPEWLNERRAELDAATVRLAARDLGDAELRKIRARLESLRAGVLERMEEMSPDVEAVQAELETLGVPPAEGEEPEAAGMAKQRAEIQARLSAIEGLIGEGELVETRVSRLLGEVARIRRDRFSQRLLARGPSPLAISVWREAVPQIVAASVAGREAVKKVVTAAPLRAQVRDSLLAVALAAGLAVLFAWPLHRWLLRRFGRDPGVRKPPFMEAMRAMLVVGAVRALLPTAAAALVYAVAVNTAVRSPAASEIANALFIGFVFFVWVVAFFRASLSPTQSVWRVLPVPDNFAAGMWRFVIALALVYSVDIVLSEIFTIYGARLELSILRDFLIALIVISLLVGLLLRQDMWRPSEPPDAKPRWRAGRIIAALMLLLFAALGVIGFVAVMKYVATQALLTGGLALLLLILHRLGREFISQMTSGDNWIAMQLRDYLRFDVESTRRLEFWSGIVYDVVLAAGGLIVGLFVWGANRDDVASWVQQALFGFRIGRINIALVDIAIAIAVVAVLVVATRFVQRTLAERVLPQTRLDVGIRESIRQATGYIGIVIAAIAGIAALGLDLSNFALIAGALTVGIGFGLQNVVNNFVSGLILLIERPVKVGDWIVVGDQQGYVKQIRVRAAEIQTFDRASVFVPNSELISGMVTNWTHADRMGRVVIPVGVAYGSDIELVRSLLLEIANGHPQVLADPAPAAPFRGFGDSSLDFEPRCFLEDVEKTISVTSDLCIAIDQAFREANIEIPFPQQDVYVKQMPERE